MSVGLLGEALHPSSLLWKFVIMEDALLQHLPLPFSIDYRLKMIGKTNTAEIQKHQTLLFQIRKYRSWFSQSDLAKVLTGVAKAKESEWALARETERYAEETAKMLRAMLHDISQSLHKHKNRGGVVPEWLKPFAEQPDQHPPDVVMVPNDAFGWCTEALIAWRLKGKVKENAEKIIVPSDPNAEVEARWADGSTWKVPGVMAK